MQEVKPPSTFLPSGEVTVFLAGSIEMGLAVDWQAQLRATFKDKPNLVFYNPRRDDWNSTWAQSIEDLNFFGQVSWEVDHIDASSIVFIYIDPETKSIVSFGELYYLLGQMKAGLQRTVIIACPHGYWRRGNIEIMCHRFGLKLHETLDEAVEVLKGYIEVST